MKRAALLLLMISLAFITTGCKNKGLTIEQAWATPGNAGDKSAVYFTINNTAGQNDQLLGASTSAAQSVELQMTVKLTGGKQTTLKQNTIPIPAGKIILFEQDRLYLELQNLTRELKKGDQFNLTFKFEKAGEINLAVKVKAP